MSIKTKHVYMFSFTKVILATKEVITAKKYFPVLKYNI